MPGRRIYDRIDDHDFVAAPNTENSVRILQGRVHNVDVRFGVEMIPSAKFSAVTYFT